MPAEVRIFLTQLSCLQRNGLSWPNRVLFIFAFRTGSYRSVEFAGPRWMVDGETVNLDPPQLLFSAPSTSPGLAVAIRGEDLGRDSQLDDTALSLELAALSVESQLGQSATPRVGRPWEAGIRALETAIDRLDPTSGSQPIFSFSRVYPVGRKARSVALSHTISDEEGEIASRYKLCLGVQVREAKQAEPWNALGRNRRVK